MAYLSVFGKKPSGKRLKRIKNSPHYKDGAFQNLEHTEMMLKGVSFWTLLREYMNKPADTVPPRPLPSLRTDLFALPSQGATVVWFGHSSYLLKIKGIYILVDPVLSGHASPFSFFGKAFPGSDLYKAGDLPDIDILILTHDHYDHLDYKTVRQIAGRTKHIYTSLGVGSHLEYWGISPEKITELDWGESAEIRKGHGHALSWAYGSAHGGEKTIGTLTATPARHFSGRTFKRNQTLWSSFVLKIWGYSIFLGGDSGWGEHFKTIGDQYGPFDLAILESGQYGKNWPYIHMLPEHTVVAAEALQARALLPVHWAKFVLALHPWNEPVIRVTRAAAEKGIQITTPVIGEPFAIHTAGEEPAIPAIRQPSVISTIGELSALPSSGKPAPMSAGFPVTAWWESV